MAEIKYEIVTGPTRPAGTLPKYDIGTLKIMYRLET